MSKIYDAMQHAFTDPVLGMGIGLLAGQNMGQGLQMGLGNASALQEQKFRQNAAIDEMLRRALELEQENEQRRYDRRIAQQRSQTYGTPEGQSPTAAIQNLVAAGLQPGTPEFQAALQNYVEKPAMQITNQMGSIPSGAAVTEEGGIRYLPGSKEYTAAQGEVNSLQGAVADIDKMMASIEQHGSESFGAESGRQRQLYGQIVSYIAKLRDMGVLQPGEMENIQEQLQNPADGMFTSNATMMAQYEQLKSQFEDKLQSKQQQYSGWGLEVPEQQPEVINMDGWTVEEVE